MFREPWISFPGAIVFLNRCDLVLAHNQLIKEQVMEIGIRSDRLHVLETRPALLQHKTLEGEVAFPLKNLIPKNKSDLWKQQ